MSAIISQLEAAGKTGTGCELETTVRFTVGSDSELIQISKESLEILETGDADVELKLTGDEFSKLNSGEMLLSRSFIKGDLKPVGSTSGVLALVALFETK